MLVKSRLAALFVVIRLLLSLIILFIALNPRSQSALLGDGVSTARQRQKNSQTKNISSSFESIFSRIFIPV